MKSAESARSSQGAVLELQRTAGNRAVVDLLGRRRPPVQRNVATRTAELDEYRSTAGKLGGAGRFEEIRTELAAYRKDMRRYTGNPEKLMKQQLKHLPSLSDKCVAYLKAKPSDVGRSVEQIERDRNRRRIVDKLNDEISKELVALSRGQSERVYLANIQDADPSKGPTEPLADFAFRALSGTGRKVAVDYSHGDTRHRARVIQETKEKYGLTDAEVQAISIFSAGDYKYINPATTNSSTWAAEQKAVAKPNMGDRFQDVDDRTTKEEGSLHTAMAMKGAVKLPRYEGESYRGARYTFAEFRKRFKVGSETSFTSLASSSYKEEVAQEFAHGLTGEEIDPQKSVAVLFVLNGAGVDISGIAMNKLEAEVLILPNSWFRLTSLERVDGNAEHARLIARAEKDGIPLPTQWYRAEYTRIERPIETRGKAITPSGKAQAGPGVAQGQGRQSGAQVKLPVEALIRAGLGSKRSKRRPVPEPPSLLTALGKIKFGKAREEAKAEEMASSGGRVERAAEVKDVLEEGAP